MVIRRKRRFEPAEMLDPTQALENPANHGESPAGLGVNLPGERFVDPVSDGRPSRLERLREDLQTRMHEVKQHETALRVTGAGIGLLIGVGVSVLAYNQIRQRRHQTKKPTDGGSS